MWFVELCLIFGTSSSVGIYDRAAKLVLLMVVYICKFPLSLVCQHLDDVCAASANKDQLLLFETTYRRVADQIGVQLAPTTNKDKAFSPCQEGTVLGVYYNTSDWTWTIPEDKLTRLIDQIRTVSAAEYVRQDEIWSLCGRIFHYAPLVPTGKFNLDVLVKANSVSADRRFPVQISSDLRKQLSFWELMLKVCAGRTKIPEPEHLFPAWTREVYTDAAGGSMEGIGRGCGAVCGTWWAYIPWSRKINCGVKAEDGKKLSRKLSALELVGPLLAISSGYQWSTNRHVRAWVDNAGSVKIWEKGYSTHCDICNTLVKAIGTVAAAIGCKFTVRKIRRRTGTGAKLADDLSKADFTSMRKTAAAAGWQLDEAPAWVPPAILAWVAQPSTDDSLGQKIVADIRAAGGNVLL